MVNELWFGLEPKEKILFKKEVKKVLIDRDMTVEDLAEGIGYQKDTVRQAISCGNKLSKFMTLAIAEKLNINLEEIRRRANGKRE